MKTDFTNIQSAIKSLVTSSLSCSYVDSEIRKASTGPNSYIKTYYLKFITDKGIRITFTITENGHVGVLFIGTDGHFSMSDYINKYSVNFTVIPQESATDKIKKYLDFINSDETLSLVIDGKDWPDIPCTFGGMK